MARHALSTLLAGAELAFLTSILGLSLALLHGIWLNRQKRALEHRSQRLVAYLSKTFSARSGLVVVQRSTNRAGYEVGSTTRAVRKLIGGLSAVEAHLKQIDARAAQHEEALKSIGQEMAATRAAMQSMTPANLPEMFANVGAELKAIHGHTHHLSASVHRLSQRAGETV